MTKIRKLRQILALSIAGMSYNTRIHSSTLSRVELRREAASARAREVISSFLGIPQDEAFNSDGFAAV